MAYAAQKEEPCSAATARFASDTLRQGIASTTQPAISEDTDAPLEGPTRIDAGTTETTCGAKLRSMQERVLQTVIFEVIGLAIVVPAYGAVFSTSDAHSLRVMVLITAVVLAWAPLHNLCFDRMELHKTGRTACSRPHYLRVAHAVSLELTSVLLTLPILLLFGHPLVEALMLNGLLTAFYTGYAYLFHLFYDRLRPITKAATIAVAPSPGEHETTGSSRGGGVRGADEVRKRRIAYELEPLAVASPQEVMSEQLPSGQVGP